MILTGLLLMLNFATDNQTIQKAQDQIIYWDKRKHNRTDSENL